MLNLIILTGFYKYIFSISVISSILYFIHYYECSENTLKINTWKICNLSQGSTFNRPFCRKSKTYSKGPFGLQYVSAIQIISIWRRESWNSFFIELIFCYMVIILYFCQEGAKEEIKTIFSISYVNHIWWLELYHN